MGKIAHLVAGLKRAKGQGSTFANSIGAHHIHKRHSRKLGMPLPLSDSTCTGNGFMGRVRRYGYVVEWFIRAIRVISGQTPTPLPLLPIPLLSLPILPPGTPHKQTPPG